MSTHPFFSLYAQGMARVAACTPRVEIADPAANAKAHIVLAKQAHEAGAAVAVFPELSLSAYAIDDLHMQATLLAAVETAIGEVAKASKSLTPVIVLGAPIRRGGRLYNCAVFIHRGTILGIVPKTFLPNYREYYEKRWFAPGVDAVGLSHAIAGHTVPFGVDLIFQAADLPHLTIHAEICEDLWSPAPPSQRGALAGATLLLNLSASPITIGKADVRRTLCAAQSNRLAAAYVYCAAGAGESTTDLAWDGQAAVYELGEEIAAGERFALDDRMLLADVDLEKVNLERLRTGTFHDAARAEGEPEQDFRVVDFTLDRAQGRPGPAALHRPLPLRAGRPGPARSGLLRGLQHPGPRPDPPPAGDRVEDGDHRRLRRPRQRPRPDRGGARLRPDGQAPIGHPRLHPARLRHRDGVQGIRLGPDAGPGDHRRGDRHQAGGDAHAGGPRPSLRQGRAGL
jgi:predicted amidohydrolase